MKRVFARLARRIIRSQLKHSSPQKLIRLSEKKLIRSFQRAAKQSPAYRTLLTEAGVEPGSVRTQTDFVLRCPVLEKANTFRRFPLEQLLAEDSRTDDIASILTSSGHGSNGFAVGLSTRSQAKAMPFLIDLGLDLAFDVDRYRTLLINCLPMGVTFQSNAVCVANVSVREDMACAIVEQTGKLFDQIVLCGDPLFLKRLCDFSEARGIDWSRYRMNAIVGEETFSESFRDYLAKTLHIAPDAPDSGLIGSSMGVGELGLNLFNETRETISLRRACERNRDILAELLGPASAGAPLPTFLAFNPLRSFVEVIAADSDGNGDLVVSVLDPTNPLPLMRYKTGDRAKLIDPERIQEIGRKVQGGLRGPSLPVIALHGRSKDYLPGGWHVDTFKDALYRQRHLARQVTGAFRLSQLQDELLWEVQLRQESDARPDALASSLRACVSLSDSQTQPKVICHQYDDFPYGRTLDYERKFVYWPG
jgi:phenylacetate-CoA ligase